MIKLMKIFKMKRNKKIQEHRINKQKRSVKKAHQAFIGIATYALNAFYKDKDSLLFQLFNSDLQTFSKVRNVLNKTDDVFLSNARDTGTKSIPLNQFISDLPDYSKYGDVNYEWKTILTFITFCHVYDIHYSDLPSYTSKLLSSIGEHIGFANHPEAGPFTTVPIPNFNDMFLSHLPDGITRKSSKWAVVHLRA